MTGANSCLRRFNRLIGEMSAAYHEAALKFGLPESAMEVLYTVCAEGDGCPISEILCQSSMSKQTLNSALRRLEREGVICLETNGGRRKRVCLTEKGKDLCRRTAMKVIAIENSILDAWTLQEQETYMTMTQQYAQALKAGIEAIE